MDGYEVCRKLKADEATAGIPVIFLTGETDVSSEVAAVGGEGYITKPIEPDTLLDRIRDCLK
jgi:putative two-component system response regulator